MNVDNCMMTWADEGMAMSENYPSEVLLYSSVLLLHCLWLQDAGRASWSGQAGLQMLTHAFGIFFHQSQGYHLQSSKGWCVVWRWKTKPTGGSGVLINNLRHCALESIIWFFFSWKYVNTHVRVGLSPLGGRNLMLQKTSPEMLKAQCSAEQLPCSQWKDSHRPSRSLAISTALHSECLLNNGGKATCLEHNLSVASSPRAKWKSIANK